MGEPGLVSREFFIEDGLRKVREEWDLTVPGCAMIAIDHRKWGSDGSVVDRRIKSFIRTETLGPA